MKKLFLIVVLLLMAGCFQRAWVQTGGPFTMPVQNFTVDLPQGWMRFNSKERLLITRDGVPLQNIIIERFSVNSELKYTKKKLKKGMLPQEAAEVIFDNLTSSQDILNFAVVENKPAKIVGYQGFRAVYTFRDKDGLKLKTICYGFIAGDLFYDIRYTAAERYYFENDLKTFEQVLKSFKIPKEETPAKKVS